MASLFKKSSDDTNSGSSNPKQKQQVLLLLLLLIVGAFAYLYYFTGLIKPREQPPKPPVQNEQVKQAIPPRSTPPSAPVQTAEGTKGAAASAEDKKGGGAAPATAPGAVKPQVAVKPAPASPQAPAPSPVAKPAAAGNAKPAAKPEAVNTAGKPTTTPPPNAKAKPNTAAAPSTVAPTAKPAGKEEKKAPGAKVAETEESDTKKQHEKKQNYSLVVKGVPNSDEAVSLKRALTNAGGKSVKVHNVQRQEPMNRLLVSQFAQRGQAEVELQKLKNLNADAFILKEGSTFGVYAGSYYSEKRASKEKAQLEAKGVSVTLKKTKVTIPIAEITAGPFGTRAAAEKAASKLRKEGVAVSIVKTRK